jgi:hypothetical protein
LHQSQLGKNRAQTTGRPPAALIGITCSIPAVAATITRETHHVVALANGMHSKLQYAFEYSDGLGHVAMRKIQAEPGKAKRCDLKPDGTFTITEIDTTPNRRWVGTGRTVLNNKGIPHSRRELDMGCASHSRRVEDARF